MSALAAPVQATVTPERKGASGHLLRLLVSAAGVLALGGLWQLGGWLIATTPSIAAFADLAPAPTFARLGEMIASGEAWRMTAPSLRRIGLGLFWAIAIGVPMGLALGAFPLVRTAANLPFQFLRMISPLSWMPIAILAFSTWDEAIVFLIAVAAIWPIMFATAAGYRRIDPTWLRVARNLGARPPHLLVHVILPAISQDVLTGIRLALGVAWVVLVPAEFLGVTSGLGYAINDARDTLEYDRLMATVLIIGAIGFALDTVCQRAIARWSWLREP